MESSKSESTPKAMVYICGGKDILFVKHVLTSLDLFVNNNIHVYTG